ncbi:hypothetical protein M8818_003627 [Zalaria obscura]|uniref:Uncharacterized protein n=1 Tax=Zalaria obscura TaxID=2024903 RepID=A0ACC3SDV0_9PEZI
MRAEEPLTSVAFTGLALRVAHMLGLHKDPSHFPDITAIEAEERRRSWWHLLHTDMGVAVLAGLLPSIANGSWDVKPISELDDELIGTQEGIEYEVSVARNEREMDCVGDRSCPQSSMITTSNILVAGKLNTSCKTTSVSEQRLLTVRSISS